MNQGNHLDQQPEVTQQAAPAAAPEVQSAQPAQSAAGAKDNKKADKGLISPNQQEVKINPKLLEDRNK